MQSGNQETNIAKAALEKFKRLESQVQFHPRGRHNSLSCKGTMKDRAEASPKVHDDFSNSTVPCKHRNNLSNKYNTAQHSVDVNVDV